MFKTPICDILNIQYPIIQGGMAWVATAELAAAVSEAGGLGIIGAGNAPASFLRGEIKKLKALTNKPYGVNVMLLSPFVEEIIEIVIEEKVPVVTTGAGNPGKYLKRLQDIGTKVIPVVSAVSLAKKMEAEGVDAVIAEGMESGGHIGDQTTIVLVPQIVDAVNIPVIAAGGIADGRGFAAALALGAQGIQMGTVFICSPECTAHENYKNAILKAGDRGTVICGRPTGHPVRCVKNKLTRQYEKLESSSASLEELEELGAGALKNAVVDGDCDRGSVMAGQIAGMVKEIKPVQMIIQAIVLEAERTIEKMKKIYGS